MLHVIRLDLGQLSVEAFEPEPLGHREALLLIAAGRKTSATAGTRMPAAALRLRSFDLRSRPGRGCASARQSACGAGAGFFHSASERMIHTPCSSLSTMVKVPLTRASSPRAPCTRYANGPVT